MQHTKTIHEEFAKLLEYPDEDVTVWLTGAQQIPGLEKFVVGIGSLSLSDLQELYTRTFDLNPVCALEIGYHLFGENYKRGEFLANLRQTEAPFELGQENQLPDYLPVLLRLLTKLEDEELRMSLITECLIPGIYKLLHGLKETENPYRALLEAVRYTLEAEAPVTSNDEVRKRRTSLPVIDKVVNDTRNELFPWS